MIYALALLLAAIDPGAPPAGPGAAVGRNRAIVARIVASAAVQIKRCYRAPRVGHDGRQIATTLHLRYTIDGMLAELPTLVSQAGVNPVNRADAGTMAEAASLAVVRCAPLHLPAEFYEGGWDEFDVTFSPGAQA